MTHPSISNIGAFIKGVLGVSCTLTAGGAGDNTEAIGAGINRSQTERSDIANGGTSLAGSCTIIIIARATLAAGKKLDVKLQIYEDSVVGGGTKSLIAAALQPSGAANSIVLTLTDGGAGGTQDGSFEFDLNLESLKQFIFISVTPDLNAANTDTAAVTAAVVLGGFRHHPM